MSIPNVVQFVYFVLPGFLAIEVFRAIYPARPRSDFIWIAWSLVYGVVITAIVFHLTGDPFVFTGPAAPSIRLVGLLIVAGVGVGLFRAGLRKIRFWISQKYGLLKRVGPDSQSIWATVNRVKNDDWAVVFLNDGSIYRGYIRRFTFDPDAGDQDFLLSEATRVDENLVEQYFVTGQGVYLRLRDVSRIEFLVGENQT